MRALPGIFFYLYTVDTYPFKPSVSRYVNVSADDDRFLQLRYLITFRQIGIKVVFALEVAVLLRLGIECDGDAAGVFHRFAVQYGQSTRHAKTYVAYQRI